MAKYHYDGDPLLAACGFSIEKQLTQVEGRVLDTPKVSPAPRCISVLFVFPIE